MFTKVLISLFALFPVLLPLDLTDIVQPASEIPGDTTTTGIGFGKPNADCSGSGICMVTADFKNDLRDGFGIAKITVSNNESVDRILLLRKSLSKNTVKKYFSGSHFVMDEPYQGYLKLGDTNQKILIPAGKYKIKKTREGFLLEVSG